MKRLFLTKLASLQQNHFIILRHCRSAHEKQLLSELAEGYNYLNMAQLNLRVLAKQDAAAFVQGLKLPVYLENLQYTPKLLPELAQLPAGSVLASCTQSVILEQLAQRLTNVLFIDLPRAEADLARLASMSVYLQSVKQCASKDIWQEIWQGQQQEAYGVYLREVLQADIMELTTVSNWLKYYSFMEAAAQLAGETLSYAKLAQLAEITPPTAKSWLKILCGTGIVYLLKPAGLKVSKNMPRLYFRDIILACYLLGLYSAQDAAQSEQSKQLLQNYAVNCLRESCIEQISNFPR